MERSPQGTRRSRQAISTCMKLEVSERRPGGHTEQENRDHVAGINLEGPWKNPAHNREGIEEELNGFYQESNDRICFSKSSVGGGIWMNLLATDTRMRASS